MRARGPLLLVVLSALAACDRHDTPASTRAADSTTPAQAAGTIPVTPAWLTPGRRAEEDSLFQSAAATAWTFADRNYVARTGLTKPFDSYGIGTMWDVASGLAAMYCATELGLLPRDEYNKRMDRALATLNGLPLFDDIGYNKEYVTESGQIIGLDRTPSTRGFGTSATDVGRLLLWLRIIATNDSVHRAAAEKAAGRVSMDHYINDGYLQGRQLSKRDGRARSFQEGRLGYEQYAAKGYASWGRTPDKAADVNENLETREIMGIEVPTDKRGGDRLTSEPWMLMGLESGWTPTERELAGRVLAVQEARYDSTRKLTMVSEDAIDLAPDYFFYNTILSKNGPWSVDVQRPNAKVTGPHWLSTKAALAWHALLPDDYTRMVFDTVRTKAKVSGVWGSGVYDNGRPTATPNINTAAVVLEAALYRKKGSPLVGGH